MKQYHELIKHVLDEGKGKGTRGIVGVKSIFGYQMRFDFRYGFPLVTTKKMPFKLLVHELLWFISGDTNIKYLNDHRIHYWDDFADKNGDLGPVYGSQWRRWPVDANNPEAGHVDQLANVIKEIKQTPNSKAMIVSAWNPTQVDEMRLPPCHTFFQFNVTKGKLKCQLYQRSSDIFLGLPFNIAQYALLTMMIAQVTGTKARELIVTIGDGHLYKNHIDQAKEMITRKPRRLPQVKLNPKVKDIDKFRIGDFELIDYNPDTHIKAPLVVI